MLLRRLIATTAIATIVSTTSLAVHEAANAADRPWVACATEDGPGEIKGERCVWDAKHRGDGQGRSFIRRDNGAIRYVSHARAHRMLAR